jgi:pyrimidine-nucleoside phosphorylase
VTGTVPSIPLIVASILSKKLAEGAGTLVFDVKCGRGAFMKTREQASALAKALVNGARGAGRKACALVTAMDMPLGFAVGNAIEVTESINVLKGEGRIPSDIVELSVEFAARMVSLAEDIPLDGARALCRENLKNGKAYGVFAEMVRLHGGDLDRFMEENAGGGRGVGSAMLTAETDGYVSDIDAQVAARAAFNLGAGRARSDDAIDMSAGVLLNVAYGDRVEKGQLLATLYARDRASLLSDEAKSLFGAFKVVSEPPPEGEIVLEDVDNGEF